MNRPDTGAAAGIALIAGNLLGLGLIAGAHIDYPPPYTAPDLLPPADEAPDQVQSSYQR